MPSSSYSPYCGSATTMSTSPLTEPLVRLFLRIDAANPFEPVLPASSDFWHLKRGSKTAPGQADKADFSFEISPNDFLVSLMINDTKHWIVSGGGWQPHRWEAKSPQMSSHQRFVMWPNSCATTQAKISKIKTTDDCAASKSPLL